MIIIIIIIIIIIGWAADRGVFQETHVKRRIFSS